jgi:hypothetical protein
MTYMTRRGSQQLSFHTPLSVDFDTSIRATNRQEALASVQIHTQRPSKWPMVYSLTVFHCVCVYLSSR